MTTPHPTNISAGPGQPRALMGIWLFPLMVAVFCLMGLGMLYHLYSAFLDGCFASFRLGRPGALGDDSSGLMDLHELLVALVVPRCIRCVRGTHLSCCLLCLLQTGWVCQTVLELPPRSCKG